MIEEVAKCPSCRCNAVTQTVTRQGRHIMTKETAFSCGAVLKEVADTEINIGSVHLRGCSCECCDRA